MLKSTLNFIGLDLSLTGTAYVVLDSDGDIVGSKVIRPKYTGVRRLGEIKEHLLALLTSLPPKTLFAVEGYAFGSTTAAHAQGELGGLARLTLYENEFPYIDVPPALVKKYATGKGNAPKEQVMLHVLKRWGHHFETNDEADAFVLAMIAAGKFSPETIKEIQLVQFQQEVLAKLGQIIKKGA